MRGVAITLLGWSFAVLVAGCQQPAVPKSNEYDVRGKVVTVAADGKTITLDHEEIPGLMEAMTMPFPVADPKLVEGLQPGDRVQGRVRLDGHRTTVIKLDKQKA